MQAGLRELRVFNIFRSVNVAATVIFALYVGEHGDRMRRYDSWILGKTL
jgi:hypothetical protein